MSVWVAWFCPACRLPRVMHDDEALEACMGVENETRPRDMKCPRCRRAVDTGEHQPCHRCPDLGGAVMPGCWATGATSDGTSLAVCICGTDADRLEVEGHRATDLRLPALDRRCEACQGETAVTVAADREVCGECGGAGSIPTGEGARLLSFISRHTGTGQA